MTAGPRAAESRCHGKKVGLGADLQEAGGPGTKEQDSLQTS